MKKLLVILFALMAAGLYAQDKTIVLDQNSAYYGTFWGAAADSAINTTAKSYIIQVYSQEPFYLDIQMYLDESTGAHAGTTKIEGSLYNGGYQAISGLTSVTWAGTADTTFHFRDTVGAQTSRFYKITFTGTGTGTTKLKGYVKLITKD